MIPLRDNAPRWSFPGVTLALILINCVIFFYESALLARSAYLGELFMQTYGAVPARVLAAVNGEYPLMEGVAPLFTSIFLHGGWLHLIGNMWFLWIFGNNIEDILGHGRFMVFYILAGLGAAAAQILSDPGSVVPMVGASGAISGIMGAYILLFPNARILTFVWLGFFITTMRIRAVWFLGIWFGMQALNAAGSGGGDGGGVAWWAHIGGFVAGILLLFFLKPRRRGAAPRRKGPWG